MDRAYSTFEIKSFDDGQGIITGIASTPETDRVGDIVEPKGARFNLPLPLLWQHKGDSPIGHVTKATVTDRGIEVVAHVARGVTAEIDNVWRMIKGGLVRGLSVGFRSAPGDREYLKGGGIRYKSWEWFELSAVTIPANVSASIQTIKTFDTPPARAATGAAVSPAVPIPAARLALPPQSFKEPQMSQETIRRMESERVAKMAAAKSIMEKALNDGRTPDAEEQQSYDAMLSEVKGIDATLDRLKEFAALDEKATNLVPTTGRPASSVATITHVKSNIDDIPGLMLARMLQAKGVSVLKMRQGEFVPAHEVAAQMFRDDPRVSEVLKATQVAGSTVSGTWAADLVTTDGGPFASFVEYLRPRTILGRFGQGGIPSLSRVPFYAPLGIQTGGGAGYWVGEGKGKGLTQFDYDKTNLAPLTVANIVVATNRLLTHGSIAVGVQFRDQLVKALQERLDTDFIDPAKAASAGISPASITNGVTLPNASGTNADAVRADIKTLFQTFIDANNAPTNGVWIMSSTTALSLSLMTNGLGQAEFPGIGMNGGTFAGLPVITSEFVPTLTAGSYIFLVNASDIWLADENGFTVDMSTEASLEMDSAPTQSSVATITAASLVSMFQTNSVAFRAERTVNWSKARASAVAGIDTVNYA
jgi:HK97 family phage prohead protease